MARGFVFLALVVALCSAADVPQIPREALETLKAKADAHHAELKANREHVKGLNLEKLKGVKVPKLESIPELEKLAKFVPQRERQEKEERRRSLRATDAETKKAELKASLEKKPFASVAKSMEAHLEKLEKSKSENPAEKDAFQAMSEKEKKEHIRAKMRAEFQPQEVSKDMKKALEKAKKSTLKFGEKMAGMENIDKLKSMNEYNKMEHVKEHLMKDVPRNAPSRPQPPAEKPVVHGRETLGLGDLDAAAVSEGLKHLKEWGIKERLEEKIYSTL